MRYWYTFLVAINLTLSSVSATLCGVLIAAMTLPLLSSRRRKKYSTYNLYLVYLAIPDLLANAFVVYLILSSHTHNTFDPLAITTATNSNDNDNHNDHSHTHEEDPESVLWMFDHPLDHNIYAFCVTANLYTNAFLTLEIYRLLSDCQKRKRHDNPTVGRTTKKALIAYGLGLFIFLLEYGASDYLYVVGGQEGDSTTTTITNIGTFVIYQVFSFVYVVLVPLSILVIVCWKIHQKGLVQSTGSMYEGRLRVLVVYFARIVISYLCLWGPASIAYMVYWSICIHNNHNDSNNNEDDHGDGIDTKIIAYNVFLLFSSTQAIVNFALSLTKPDARKLVVEFLKCYNPRCCKHSSTSNDTNEDNDDDDDDVEDPGNGKIGFSKATTDIDNIDPYLDDGNGNVGYSTETMTVENSDPYLGGPTA